MKTSDKKPIVTICVLTHGDHTDLLDRCIRSIVNSFDPTAYELIIGGNSISQTTSLYLDDLKRNKLVKKLYLSRENINKCPLMRKMFSNITSEFIWWLDDDSHIYDDRALHNRIEIARAATEDTVMWGHVFFQSHEEFFSYGLDVAGYVRSTPWYCGKALPSWKPGGKDEYNFEGTGTGDGRWFYICGACWLIRTKTIQALDWPDLSMLKPSDDIFLCEAIRQQGWKMEDIGAMGVHINDGPRRGDVENILTMMQQVVFYNPHLRPSHFF